MLSSNPSGKTGLSREVQAKIGQQLRSIYNDVVDQGVPDRFAKLLAQLDENPPRNDSPESFDPQNERSGKEEDMP